MVRLVYSNRTEELLAELGGAGARAAGAGRRARAGARRRPEHERRGLRSPRALRARHGIAANLDASLLTRFAAEVACPPERARGGRRGARVDGARRSCSTRRCWPSRISAPVRAYLRAAGDAPDAVDVRRVQLAGAPGAPLRGVHVLARGDARVVEAAGPRSRASTPRPSAGSGDSGWGCSARAGSRRARTAADRPAARGRRGARASPRRGSRARCMSLASRTSRGRSTRSSSGSGERTTSWSTR